MSCFFHSKWEGNFGEGGSRRRWSVSFKENKGLNEGRKGGSLVKHVIPNIIGKEGWVGASGNGVM